MTTDTLSQPLVAKEEGEGYTFETPENLYTPGDSVYVKGHGPAEVLEARMDSRSLLVYGVQYPDGSTADMPINALLPHLRRSISFNSPNLDSGPFPSPPFPSNGEDRERLELLRPAMDAPSRQLFVPNAVFNLVCTMAGGGMLALPYAFRACGILVGAVILMISGIASAFTMDMLISCGRADGSDSYDGVVANALGFRASQFSGLLMFLLTFMASVAYLVLVGDLLSPIVTLFGVTMNPVYRSYLLVGVAIIVSPLAVQKSLSALRVMNVVGLVMVMVVASILGWVALPQVGNEHSVWVQDIQGLVSEVPMGSGYDAPLRWFPAKWGDMLYAFPIFGLSFLAHFNVLPVQSELQWPTRRRVSSVVLNTMVFSTGFYMFVGVTGYMYAGDHTCGNTLLNYPGDSMVLAFARCGLAFCLTNNLPLLMQPCRGALYRLVSSMKTNSEESDEGNDCPSSKIHVYRRKSENLGTLDLFTPKMLGANAAEMPLSWRIASTLSILGVVTTCACLIPSILTVWTLMGSTTCFLVAFIFPAAAWLNTRGRGARLIKVIAAWVTLVLFSILCICCTAMTLLNTSAAPCPGS